ncbi:hypothetical protein [Desulfocurvus sp. DL9XJH121]
MSLAREAMREHVRGVILERLDREAGRRAEALTEFFAVTMADADPRAVDRLAELVPPVLPELYEKWVAMFLERFFETVPMDQLEHLCDGSEGNNAALILVYLMFLESERMEAQIDKDLREYGHKMTGADDAGDLAAAYIRARMAKLGKDLRGSGDN